MSAGAGEGFPPMDKVVEGYEKVPVLAGAESFYTIYTREKDAQLIAELPKDLEGKRWCSQLQ